jgi:hypothetical protein
LRRLKNATMRLKPRKKSCVERIEISVANNFGNKKNNFVLPPFESESFLSA